MVGVILLIFVHGRTRDGVGLRCNVSSWYVEPAYRAYAGMLSMRALRRKDVTYYNITPAPHTRTMLRALGYSQYSSGELACLPVLNRRQSHAVIEPVTRDTRPGADLPQPELAMLHAHETFGCLTVACNAGMGREPFVFAVRRLFGAIPIAVLIYCRSPDQFVRYAGELGLFLMSKGILIVEMDVNGPVRGLFGVYRSSKPRYYKGQASPPLGDVSYSELAMFLT